MRGRRLGPQPRGVRGDPPLRAGPRPPERQPALLIGTVRQTERLLLRRFRPEDAATLRRWHADERYMRYMGATTEDPADTDRALSRWTAHWDEHGFGLVAVEDRESGALVGRGGPQYHRTWPDDPEVGWAVDPAWWGRGLATEMGAAFLAWAFGDLGYRRVVSITVEENLASRRVMEKLGFAFLTTVTQASPARELQVYSQEAPLD